MDAEAAMYDLDAVIRTAAAAAAGAVAMVKATRTMADDLTHMHERRRAAAADQRRVDAAKTLLGIHQPRAAMSYRSDNMHPLYRETAELHPDNRLTLATVAGDQFSKARDAGCAEFVDRVPSALADSQVLVGSAASEGITRLVFGYEPEPGVEDSLVRSTDAPVPLPYTFVLDRDRTQDRETASRYVPGRGRVVRPNWRIEGPDRTLYIPEVDNEGWLAADYLLITRLRNFLAPHAWKDGRTVVSIGGTHGTGTRATETLLGDDRALQSLADRVGNHPCFQALFRATDIRHSKRDGSAARTIELVDVQVIGDTEERWDTAAHLVAPRVADWSRQHAQG